MTHWRSARALTADDLRALLSYNEETGEFHWLVAPNRSVLAGDIAGWDRHGYQAITIKGRKYAAHRLAWLYVHGVWPSELIDHIDGNTCNNAISNLREATLAQNQHNAPARGCRWDKREKKFRAELRVNGQYLWLGYFPSAEAAQAAYWKSHKELTGSFSFAARPSLPEVAA